MYTLNHACIASQNLTPTFCMCACGLHAVSVNAVVVAVDVVVAVIVVAIVVDDLHPQS